jgi:hypothetical protein
MASSEPVFDQTPVGCATGEYGVTLDRAAASPAFVLARAFAAHGGRVAPYVRFISSVTRATRRGSQTPGGNRQTLRCGTIAMPIKRPGWFCSQLAHSRRIAGGPRAVAATTRGNGGAQED